MCCSSSITVTAASAETVFMKITVKLVPPPSSARQRVGQCMWGRVNEDRANSKPRREE